MTVGTISWDGLLEVMDLPIRGSAMIIKYMKEKANLIGENLLLSLASILHAMSQEAMGNTFLELKMQWLQQKELSNFITNIQETSSLFKCKRRLSFGNNILISKGKDMCQLMMDSSLFKWWFLILYYLKNDSIYYIFKNW